MINNNTQSQVAEAFQIAPPILLWWDLFLTLVIGVTNHLTQGVLVDIPATFVLVIHNLLPFIYEGHIWSLGDTK